MKKKFYLISSIILFISINGCTGYEPIFGSKSLQLEIANYSIEGDNLLGNQIYSKLYRLSKSNKDDENTRRIDFFIKVSKDKIPTSKDSAGKILEYKMTLSTLVIVKDFITNDEILNHTFVSSLSYKVQDQYSETVKLENRSTGNLINNIYQELLMKLSQNILTK